MDQAHQKGLFTNVTFVAGLRGTLTPEKLVFSAAEKIVVSSEDKEWNEIYCAEYYEQIKPYPLVISFLMAVIIRA